MQFRDTFNYYFRNSTISDMPAKFKISKPSIMSNNLQKKEIRVQKFYLNNLAVPIFIPDRVTSTNYFNVTTDATNNYVTGDTLTANSLQYYIILRDVSNTGASIVYLQQPAINFGVSAPAGVVYDDNSYYQNKYYYYYDFTHFLSVIVDAIQTARTNMLLPAVKPPINPIFWINNSGFFQLFIQNEPNWYVEFSPSLINLFPFKNIQISADKYRLVFNDVPATINGNTYNEVDAKFYDTIFPFTQLLFKCDDGNLNPITFIDEGVLNSNSNPSIFESSILTYDIETNDFNGIYNFYKYVNNEDTLWVNFYTDSDLRNHFTISLYLRLRNNLLIPYQLKPNELATFTIEVKYLDA